MNFRVGQKVVCIDDTDARLGGRSNGLVKGDVYTVARTGLTNSWAPDKRPCIAVVELPEDRALWAHRFRPVVERKTDISFAHEILRKATKPAPARAMSLHNRECDF